MDGLFHGKPYEQMDDLGGKTQHPYNDHALVFSMMILGSPIFG